MSLEFDELEEESLPFAYWEAAEDIKITGYNLWRDIVSPGIV